ncbi:AAA family ATPase [uncultured Adlercreutzia sp.]|uniref:ATP-binding protein n=1 Tax=uncultured Adlercreutzia sp. TaxID=875803 RepID=UPI0025CD1D55|nr:AAA family ATPase [uncultured Adlercreutzia sp.]
MVANPFKPTAGKMPPILIGRQSIIDDFREGLANGAGAPGRLMLVMGQRGYGKTVMLTEMRRIADDCGWLTISETASEGLTARLINALNPKGWHLEGATVSPSVGIPGVASASLGNASIAFDETAALTLRNAIQGVLDSRKVKKGNGILFTIDETQAASHDDMVAIATAVQHIITDQDLSPLPDSQKKGVAFAFAGLPSLVDELVNHKVLTFLRRSLKRELGDVPLPDVRNAYVESFTDSGKQISDGRAAECAQLSGGYPYMIQLIGYYVWQSAEREGRTAVTEEDVARGFGDALQAFGDAVCAPAFDALSSAARKFVLAMAEDGEGPTLVADVAQRAGKSRSWANKYREVLIAEKVIVPADFGYVRFAIPHLAKYLENARRS